MASARPVYKSLTWDVLPSPDSDISVSGEVPPILDEVSPLLKQKRMHTHKQIISERWCTARSSFINDNSGLLLVAGSQFFFSAMGIAVKWLNSLDDPVPTLELILIRMVITYVCSVAYMYWKRIPDPLLGPKGLRTLLVLRGLTGFFSLAGMYFSLQHLSLSDATVLTFIAPILTGFSGAVFLKEYLSLRETLAGLYSFFGVVLIARPQFLFGSQAVSDPSEELLVTPAQRMTSVIAALIGVLGATATFTVLRALGKRAHILHSLTFFASQCMLGSTLGMVLFEVPLVIPTHALWLAMLFVVGILGLIGQTLLTMGLQREAAGRGTLAIYSSIVFALMFEFIFSHTTPSALSIVGTLIIMSSAIYITLTKKTAKLDTASKWPAPNHDGDPEA